MWNAKYLNRVTGHTYWRTVYADTPNEASREADKYANKGYMCSYIELNKFS